MHHNLVPEVEAEDTKYRFLGIQAKNRKEWNLLHLANMCVKATTVGLYDTLGEEAIRFVIDQTEMTTIAASIDLIPKLVEFKEADGNSKSHDGQKLQRLANLICYEPTSGLNPDIMQTADNCGIKILSLDEIK